MKILLVADVSILKVIGGAERVLLNQGLWLLRGGHDVYLLTRRLPDHKQENEIIHGISEWRYDVDSKNTVSFLRTTWRNSKKLFERLNDQYCFDAIIFHQPFSAIGIVQSSLGKNIKKIYVCHSLSFEEYISRNKKPDNIVGKILYGLNVQFRKRIEGKSIKRCDAVVVLSSYTREKLETIYKIQKVSIIPGSVDLSWFFPADSKQKIRKSLEIPEKKVILFTVRNLVKRMGLENLIEAMEAVVKVANDVYLVLGGSGPLEDELKKTARRLGLDRYVRFTGFIPEGKLSDYYKSADLFVLPTKELEGFGLVTLESMASGVPVLGTPVGGTKEILGQFDPTFLFKDTSASSMAELILEKYRIIKEKPDDWKEISKKCRQFVEDNYSWEKHVDDLEKHF